MAMEQAAAATRGEVGRIVIETLADELKIDEQLIALESNITTDLGAESLDCMQLGFRLEKRLNFRDRIPRDQLSSSVERLIDFCCIRLDVE